MPTRDRRRPPASWLVWGFIALLGFFGVAFVLSGVASGDPESGYGLRAETMLPSELSVRPNDLTCPDEQALSPVDFLDAGPLAKSLPVYDGDLIAVRILALPTGAAAEEISFSANWPASVVGDTQPGCVFIVDDGSNPAVVDWEENPEVGTRFVLSNTTPGVPTEIEIWLTADDPTQGTTFQTALFPDVRGDDIVLDPLGGRVDIDRRPGSIPTLAVVAEPVDADGGLFELTATVSNQSPRTRSLDVLLRLDAPGSPMWTVTDQTPDVQSCRPGSTLECSLGDLASGQEATISALVQLAPGWAPLAGMRAVSKTVKHSFRIRSCGV